MPPKVFTCQNLDPASLGGLVDLVGNIALGDAKARSRDVLGHVFEYFLGEFALAKGKQGGQFYTPRSIVNLPAKLFLNTQIPAGLWFMNRARNNGHPRKGEILFIGARNLGHLINRRTKELSHDDIGKIAATYHAWRTGEGDDFNFAEHFTVLKAEVEAQLLEEAQLNRAIREN